MIGIPVLRNEQGAPYGALTTRIFQRDDVVAFGKLRRYNDCVVRFMVRLCDGTECFVFASKQARADANWLGNISYDMGSPGLATRDSDAERWVVRCSRGCGAFVPEAGYHLAVDERGDRWTCVGGGS